MQTSVISATLESLGPAGTAATATVAAKSTKQSDTFYKEQIDKAYKESKILQQRVHQLEQENVALKKSVYDLSLKLSLTSVGGGLVATKSNQQPAGAVSAVANNSVAKPSPYFMPDFDMPEDSPDPELTKVGEAPAERNIETTRLTTSEKGPLRFQYELAGHSGAVYCVEYSPCGRFLASGSFDKTIKLWDSNSTECLTTLKKHSLNVSCIAWHSMPGYMELLSGSYDGSSKRWDLQTWQCVDSFDTDGFVQCIKPNPSNENIFYYGTTRKVLCMVDKRKRDPAITIRTDGMVNALHVYSSGSLVMTGDSNGYLKTWDMRNLGCLQSTLNDERKHSISCISTCHVNPDDADGEPRFMAVNSYDDVVRVYDRGWTPLKSPLKLIHSLRSQKIRNWPIQSCFFTGDLSSQVQGDFEYLKARSSDAKQLNSRQALLLASGSSTPSAAFYVLSRNTSLRNNDTQTETFGAGVGSGASNLPTALPQADISTSQQESPTVKVDDQSPGYLQMLDEHKDRVYATAFHPKQLVLATGSADFRVCVWNVRSHSLTKALKLVLDVDSQGINE